MIITPDTMSWIWLGVMILCLVIEGLTWTLTTIWAAIASLPLIFIARTPLPLQWQILIFAVLTLVLVVFTRPLVVKKFKKPVKTNADALEGKTAPVTSDITETERGTVRLSNGTEWQARTASGAIHKGEHCIIERIEGNTLIVKPVPTDIESAKSTQPDPQVAPAEGEQK